MAHLLYEFHVANGAVEQVHRGIWMTNLSQNHANAQAKAQTKAQAKAASVEEWKMVGDQSGDRG